MIVDNSTELDIIQKAHAELKQAPLVLLSSNFSLNKLKEFEERRYHYFDEQIDEADAKKMAAIILERLWTWFLDENGRDLSLIDGCSLGRAFASSLEILFNTVFRYIFGLSKLLKPEHEIYYASNTEDIFLKVIVFLQKQIGFKINSVETKDSREEVTYANCKIKMDPTGRKRDLAPLFLKDNLINKWISYLAQLLKGANDKEKRVLLMPGGKLDQYFNHLKNKGAYGNLRFILRLSKKDLINLVFSFKKKVLFYHFHSSGNYKASKIDAIISSLKQNMIRKITEIDPEILISVMNQHTFPYFNGAYAYYYNACKVMKALKPHLVVISAGSYENFILLAQAAKHIGIPTAHIPHGLYGWGYSEYLSGTDKVFDYGFAFGEKDVLDYRDQGMEDSQIHVTSFPYFSRFFPIVQSRPEKYQKALILPLDFYNLAPGEKIKEHFQYLANIIQLLKGLKIQIIGVKARAMHTFKNMGLQDDYLEYDEDQIPLLSGYSSFPEAAKNADLIIGPPSTALIEAAFLGKDYFAFSHSKFHETVPSILPHLYRIVNVAFTMEELRINILNKQPYHPGYTVGDLVDIEDIEDKNDFYRKFEKVIWNIVNAN